MALNKNSIIVFGIIAVILIWLIFFNGPSSFGAIPPMVPGTPFYDQIQNIQLINFSKNTYTDVVTRLQSVVHSINFNILQMNNALNNMPIPQDRTMLAALYTGLTEAVNSKDFSFERVYNSGREVMNTAKNAGISYKIFVPPLPKDFIKQSNEIKPYKRSIENFINGPFKSNLTTVITNVVNQANAQNNSAFGIYIKNLENLKKLIPFVPANHAPATTSGTQYPCQPESACDFMFYLFNSGPKIDAAIGGVASAIWMGKNGYPIAPPVDRAAAMMMRG